MSTTRFALASLTALAATAGALVAPSAASAATPTITQAASVRSCTNLGNINCQSFTTVAAGTQLTMVCWRDESWATGAYSSNRWFLVRRNYDGLEGFVHSSLVRSQTATPNCSAVPRVMAGLHALNRVGQVTANSADAALFRDWAPGPYGEWSGDCKKLVSTAWYRATGAPLVSVNAKPELRLLLGAALPEGLRYPRSGSLVGFNTYLPYGHIAVAVGGNRIASTRGVDGNRLANAIQTTSSYPSYAGWVVP